jgi:hypothetical protein
MHHGSANGAWRQSLSIPEAGGKRDIDHLGSEIFHKPKGLASCRADRPSGSVDDMFLKHPVSRLVTLRERFTMNGAMNFFAENRLK